MSTRKRRRDSTQSLHNYWQADRGVTERPQKSHKTEALREAPSSPTDQFASLLDLSSLTSITAISSRFDEIADALFFEHQLSLTCGEVQTAFEIIELEFYLQKPGCHEDPFTHGSEEQKQSGRWYFHRAPTRSQGSHRTPTAAGGYRGGSRKGLDLTFGGPGTLSSSISSRHHSNLRGGILIRTLRCLSDSKVVSGPSVLVDEILRLSGAASISQLVEQKWAGNISAWPSASPTGPLSSTSLFLQRRNTTAPVKKPPMYRSPRIGLDLSHPSTTNAPSHPRVVYVSKPYRYFIHPELLTSNGRVHTFLGVYQACRESGRYDSNENGLKREIVKLTRLTERTVSKYLEDHKLGVEHGFLKSFIGAAGKGASASPSTSLRMMGTLARLQAVDTDVKD